MAGPSASARVSSPVANQGRQITHCQNADAMTAPPHGEEVRMRSHRLKASQTFSADTRTRASQAATRPSSHQRPWLPASPDPDGSVGGHPTAGPRHPGKQDDGRDHQREARSAGRPRARHADGGRTPKRMCWTTVSVRMTRCMSATLRQPTRARSAAGDCLPASLRRTGRPPDAVTDQAEDPGHDHGADHQGVHVTPSPTMRPSWPVRRAAASQRGEDAANTSPRS